MTTELHMNGAVCVDLQPVDPLEVAVMQRILEAAERGQAVKVERLPGEPLKVRVSVER